MPKQRPRVATIVLGEPDGTAIGRLPALRVATPWWQDMAPLIDACRERFGLRPTILRLLQTDGRGFPGGHVTYLGEVATPRTGCAGPSRSSRRSPRRRPANHPGDPQR